MLGMLDTLLQLAAYNPTWCRTTQLYRCIAALCCVGPCATSPAMLTRPLLTSPLTCLLGQFAPKTYTTISGTHLHSQPALQPLKHC
jgi:hypothetical protein